MTAPPTPIDEGCVIIIMSPRVQVITYSVAGTSAHDADWIDTCEKCTFATEKASEQGWTQNQLFGL